MGEAKGSGWVRIARRGLVAALALALLGGAAVWTAGRDPGPPAAECRAGPVAGGASALPLRSTDGLCLQAYLWQPNQPARGAVLLVHGLQDHAQRHAELARSLQAQGLAVLAFDLRGHGRSGGHAQRIDGLAQALGDLDTAATALRQRQPQRPLFLYGHSFGGLLAAHQVSRQPQVWQGLVLSSAALQRPAAVSPGAERLLAWLAGWAPNLGVEPLQAERLLRQPEAQAALRADPLIHPGKLPVRSVATLLAALRELPAHAGPLPQLLLHGAADAVTPPEGSQSWAQRQAQAKLLLFPQARHDLQHEPEAAQAREAIAEFLRAQLRG